MLRIILYSADWRGVCTRAKRYLASKGTAVDERNVDVPKFAEELLKKTGERGIRCWRQAAGCSRASASRCTTS